MKGSPVTNGLFHTRGSRSASSTTSIACRVVASGLSMKAQKLTFRGVLAALKPVLDLNHCSSFAIKEMITMGTSSSAAAIEVMLSYSCSLLEYSASKLFSFARRWSSLQGSGAPRYSGSPSPASAIEFSSGGGGGDGRVSSVLASAPPEEMTVVRPRRKSSPPEPGAFAHKSATKSLSPSCLASRRRAEQSSVTGGSTKSSMPSRKKFKINLNNLPSRSRKYTPSSSGSSSISRARCEFGQLSRVALEVV
mmetsp:Transcript_83804/g.218247  ORF Transcript_83804/g.218247 Transcript_83804/m.218247 type:complete len:250 (-) Transcript_83804:190-939(-)